MASSKSLRSETIRVFRAGEYTSCEWSFEDDVYRFRIASEGDGEFFPDEFTSVSDARDFCLLQLPSDPSVHFYIVTGDIIVDSVRDKAWHAARDRRWDIIYGVISTTVFAVAACLISVYSLQFETFKANCIFVACMAGLYLFLWLIMGGGSHLEGAVAMTVLLVLIALLSWTLPTIREQFKGRRAQIRAVETRPGEAPVDQ